MKIREMRPEDWNDVRRIYLEGIATGIATFQQSAPEYEDWDRGHLADCRLVAGRGGSYPGMDCTLCHQQPSGLPGCCGSQPVCRGGFPRQGRGAKP